MIGKIGLFFTNKDTLYTIDLFFGRQYYLSALNPKKRAFPKILIRKESLNDKPFNLNGIDF